MNRLVLSMFLVLACTFLASTYDATGIASTTPAQEAPSAQPAPKALSLPADTMILAKLIAPLDLSQCKPGDRVEAEILHDVKAGHDKLERGAHVIGQVTKLACPDGNGMYAVWITFDKVAMKHGDQFSLNMDMQAISAPETGDNADGVTAMGVPVNLGGTEGPHGELTTKSSGVIKLPGLTLTNGVANGKPLTVLASKDKIRLVKGTQVVFRVINP
jgi:hypothetical protein